MQGPAHKQHGFRILPHNPEVAGSSPVPATKQKPESFGLWFLLRQVSRKRGASLLISKLLHGFLKFKTAEGVSQRIVYS